MTGTLPALKACQDDLMKKWGVDPEDRVAESDTLNPAAWFGGDAYPTDAIRLGAGGRTVALITVRNDGKAKTCRTVIKSGTESLDRRVCQIAMTRAHFPKAERDPKAPLRWTLLPVAWAID